VLEAKTACADREAGGKTERQRDRRQDPHESVCKQLDGNQKNGYFPILRQHMVAAFEV
jgi:hypothetical protein